MSANLAQEPSARCWTWREALLAYAMIAFPGFAVEAHHPWRLVNLGAPPGFTFVWAAVLVGLVWRFLLGRGRRIPAFHACVATLALLAVLIPRMMEIHYAQRYVGDNTDALEIGAMALLTGHNPYLFHTHIGNPIGPLLGGLILAVPFQLLMGSLDFLSILWLVVGFFFLRRSAGVHAACAYTILLMASPWARFSLPYANDNGVTAGVVVLLAGIGWWLATRPEASRRWWWIAVWAPLFASALIYRFTMWGIVVPLAVLFLRKLGWKRALTWLAPAGICSIILLVLPLVHRPEAYLEGPWKVTVKSDNVSPLATPTLLVFTIMCLAIVSWQARSFRAVVGGYAVCLAGILTIMAIFAIPEKGVIGALADYHTAWYWGWVLVMGLVGLVFPRDWANGEADSVTPQLAVEA